MQYNSLSTKDSYIFEFMSGEVHLVPVASISGHTKPRDNAHNSLYQHNFDAVQSINVIKLVSTLHFYQNICVSRKNAVWKSFGRLQR